MKDQRLNFKANPRERHLLIEHIRALPEREYRVTIIPWRERRSDRQNRYYWPAIVVPFGDYLRQSKPHFTDEMAHEVLKRLFLETTIIDEITGQPFTYVRSTTELDTAEFSEYVDQCAAMLATDCGLRIRAPGEYATV